MELMGQCGSLDLGLRMNFHEANPIDVLHRIVNNYDGPEVSECPPPRSSAPPRLNMPSPASGRGDYVKPLALTFGNLLRSAPHS